MSAENCVTFSALVADEENSNIVGRQDPIEIDLGRCLLSDSSDSDESTGNSFDLELERSESTKSSSESADTTHSYSNALFETEDDEVSAEHADCDSDDVASDDGQTHPTTGVNPAF